MQDEDEGCLDDTLEDEDAGDKKGGKRTKMATVKGPWAKEEDDVVIRLVGQYGPKRWSLIASNLPGREFRPYLSPSLDRVRAGTGGGRGWMGEALASQSDTHTARGLNCFLRMAHL